MKFLNWKIGHADFLPQDIRRADIIIYGIILLSCFLLFQQTDLLHTTSSSYAYLNGRFQDFYDYNKLIVGGNDYFPIIYAIFAIWNFPLHVLGLTSDITLSGYSGITVIEVIWSKLLLVIFFFATAVMMYKTALIVTEENQNQSRLTAGIFATAPIGVFAVFIFGQYDIIGTFFTISGFYFYLRKDFRRFAWLFSIALSFKFFAVLLFIPLLLLAEKRLLQLVKLTAIALVVPVIQLLLYWNNQAFSGHIFSLATSKVDNVTRVILSLAVLVIAYSSICIYAFIKKPKDDSEWRKISIFISIAAYGLMFAFVVWHPQWLIIITPFFALAHLYIKDKFKFYLIDIIGMLAFVWWLVNAWPRNVDVSMLSWGPLRSFFEYIPLINADLMSIRVLPMFKVLFTIYLFSPLLLLALQRLKSTSAPSFEGVTWLFRMRFVLGVATFVVPSLFCALAPQEVARIFNPIAYSKPGLVFDASVKPVGEIVKGSIVTQTFKAEHANLSAVSISLSTYRRKNDTQLKIYLLSDDGGEIATQTVNGKRLTDNAFHPFRFPTIVESKNKTFQIKISSPDGTPGNAVTAWMNEAYIYPEGHLSLNGVPTPGALSFKLYYEW